MSTDIVPTRRPSAASVREDMELAQALAGAGIFGSPAHVLVKILAARELGFGPVAGLQNIHITEDGKLIVGYVIQAGLIRGSGRYDYRENERTEQACSLTFLRKEGGAWQPVGTERITLADAQARGWHVTRAGKLKDAWLKTPGNLLFARCITNGFKFYCPDLSAGVSLYDPDELDTGGPAVDAEYTVTRDGKAAATDGGRAGVVAASAGGPAANAPAPAVPQGRNAPATPPATTRTIGPEQREALVQLARTHQRTTVEVSAMLAAVNCKVLDQLPANLAQWAATVLTDGAITPPQSVLITQLVERRGASWPAFESWLEKTHGVRAMAMLSILQAQKVIETLQAPRPTPQPAAAGG